VSQGAQEAIRYAWYQQVTSYGLAVTAEVAGSSPVVPAIQTSENTRFMASDPRHQALPRVLKVLAPFSCLALPPESAESDLFASFKGAESAFFLPASKTIVMTRSLASRFVAEIARV
jgi:hypothetical protein